MKSRKRKETDYGVLRHEMAMLANATPEQQHKAFEHCTAERLAAFDVKFEQWAHKNQLPPNDKGWTTWLMMAGRGFGKTRAGAEWIFGLAEARPNVRIALAGATIADARSIMVEGVSGLLAVAHNYGRKLKWEPSLGRLTWPNGSQAQLFSGDNADGFRGPEHDFAWCDELAKWRQAEEAWDNLQMTLRRGIRPRALITTTPRPGPLLERIRTAPKTVTTTGRTRDNINLDEQFVDLMTATYGGTRFGRQELDGELFTEVEGALWTRDMIEKARAEPLPRDAFDRVVVGVDPPVGDGPTSDACGIVVAGRSGEKLFVIEDASVQGLGPAGWARRVAAVADRWDTRQVIAEVNNGGALVSEVLEAADRRLKVRRVHASVGKSARAEPIAVKFETGQAFLAGVFPELEAEMAGMKTGGGYEGTSQSPDRADAMVWALTALGVTRSGLPRVRRL